MKIAKKTLSVFLAFLMMFSACSVGLTGVVSFAAEGDSKYPASEVVDLINAAIADGYTAKSSANATNVPGDDGDYLAAAEAIYDYAIKTYRAGRSADSANNSGDTLYTAFVNEFTSKFSDTTAQNAMKALALDILNPNGTEVFGYENKKAGTNYTLSGQEEDFSGADITSSVPDANWNSAVKSDVKKTVSVTVDLESYLLKYESLAEVPTTIYTSVSYTYNYTSSKSAIAGTATSSGGCSPTYSATTTPYSWNYMSAKPVRVVTKNTTAKKYLMSIDKFFTEDILSKTQEDLLAMSLADLEYLHSQVEDFRIMMEENFTDAILANFGFSPANINAFIERLDFAYRTVAGVDAIDTLIGKIDALRNEDKTGDGIGDGYDVESYSEMASLYTKTKNAYDVVDTMKSDVSDFILNNTINGVDYSKDYENVQALLAEAESLLAVLYDIMTEQRFEELIASMSAKYSDYYLDLDKEDFETPTDDEVSHLASQVESWKGILDSYLGYSYYETYFPQTFADTETESKLDQAEWTGFCTKLNEVVEARGLKASYTDFYNWFYYTLYTNEIVDAEESQLMSLFEEFDDRLVELRAKYSEIVDKYGNYVIADKIFTINYEGEDFLLQTLLELSKTAGLEAVKNNLVDRAEADLDAVLVYSGVTVVNFDNFAEIKSTLSHYNYDLYDYVTGENREKTNWLSQEYIDKHAQVQVLLDKYHAFSTAADGGKSFFLEATKDFGFADENGIYATRYAGSQFVKVDGVDDDGNPVTAYEQIGYPTDIARDGADDDFVVNKALLEQTVVKLDKFIASRDFGALVGLVDSETEEMTDLKTFVNQMLSEMLYTDEMMNTLVGAIFPMIVDLVNEQLIGQISSLGAEDGAPPTEPRDPNASGAINVGALGGEDLEGSGTADLYLDDDLYNGSHNQNYFSKVFADLGLYIYPTTFADSLAISNPSFYGPESEIYQALKAADRDWSKLVCADDPDTLDIDETKNLEFAWGVYDQESFLDALACVLDSILPLLQAALAGANYSEFAANAAYASVDKIVYTITIIVDIPLTVNNVYAYGGLNLSIVPLNLYADLIVPLFQVLGVENIPTLNSSCSADDIVNAIFGTLLKRVDQILDAPLDTILSILPNLVYWLSMDSVQEIINSLVINLNVGFELEIDTENEDSGTLARILGSLNLEGMINDMLQFEVPLDVSSMLDLYDLLGFEITNFNEVLAFAIDALSGLAASEDEASGTEGTGLNILLPTIRQQDIIFCSEWTTRADGSVNLVADKAELLYWFLSFAVEAIQGGLLDSLLGGSEMDPTLEALLDKVIYQFSANTDGAVAAIVELLNPETYDLEDMDWIKQGAWDYNEIEGTNQMSIVYLNYGNDWTRADAEYLVDNVDSIVKTVLDLAGVEGMDDLGAFLQDTVNGLFTNETITSLVEMLGGLGDSPSAVIADILTNQIGLDLESWFVAYGYLFPAETWAEDAEVIRPDSQFYVNNFGVEGTANADGTITWSFNKMPLVDGDGYTFINIITRLLGGMKIAVDFLFGGADISVFNNVVTLKGYDTYNTTFGLLFEMLGVQNLPTQADFKADAMGSLTSMLHAVLDWFYALTSSETMIADLLELIPDLFYFIESNGLSTLLQNLLMPVLVLVDTVRPLFDVDINGVLSYLISDFLNYSTVDMDGLLQVLIYGNNPHFDDIDYQWYSVDVKNLTLSEILKIADKFIGTDLYSSGLVQIGLKGLCSGVEAVTGSSVGDYYRTTVDAADTITILVTALLDCLEYPAQDKSIKNGDALFQFIAEMTENEDIANLYGSISEILAGIEYEYDFPNWGYMFSEGDVFTPGKLPQQTIVYLGYNTDWDKETADGVYSALDSILDLVLPEVLEEGETIATLLNGLLEDNVYSEEILNTIVEALVNLLADFDQTLFELIDVVVATDISAWFTFCELDETTGEYVCTKDWQFEEDDTVEEKKAKFIAGIKEVLAPANALLEWLFFGTEYTFFTSSEVDENGEYTFADLLTLKGGEGYAYALVPLFEALGCTMQPAETYYNAETGSYNVGDAVEGILNSVLALVDKVSANPVEEVFNLLPNLIYFINADGAKVVVNNLLAPVNAIIERLSPVIGDDVSITGLLEDVVGFDIGAIDMKTLLQVAADNGVVLNKTIVEILCGLYVGKLAEFDSANGSKSYRLNIKGYEGDVLTIILSLALELFTINKDLFAPLVGEDIYLAIIKLLSDTTSEFEYIGMNWGYMYDGEDSAERLEALKKANGVLPERENIAYDVYTTYQNNWNESTADYVTLVLDTLVHDITTALTSDGSTLGNIIDKAISDELYQDSILNSLIEMVVELMLDYEDIVKGAGALLGAESIANWFEYCEVTTDENGDTVVTCTKDWGIDSKETIDEKRVAFVDAFAEALQPAYRLLAWLFFGEDYTFFNSSTGDVLITLKGGKGYEKALIPLLEGAGVTMRGSIPETYLNGTSSVVPASYFYVDGKLDMELAVKTIFGAVTGWLVDICGDLDNPAEDGALTSMLEKLANLIYFVNADGLVAVVNNLTAPVMRLLNELGAFGLELDINGLIGIKGMDIFNFGFDDVFALLADPDILGLYFPDYTQEFLKTFYIGEVVPYTSANGDSSYFMTYTEEESAADMITVLLGFVVDAVKDPKNDVCLIDWLGEDVYKGIMAVLDITELKDMQDFNWLYTEYADKDYEFNATQTSVKYSVAYNTIWTRDKAEYISQNILPFVNNILGLIGLEIAGVEVKNIDDLLDSLLEGNLYTQATVDSLLDLVRDLISQLTSLEPYGEYIVGILDKAFGVDLAAWDKMTLKVEPGSRDSFIAAMGEILAPIVPLLDVLLCGENIELFYSIAPENVGESAVVIHGSEGYAYGIVPLLEALGCEMMAPDAFKALKNNEDKASAIIASLVARIDVILADPVTELFKMIPELVYFINSNGLDTAVNNILNSVDTVLIALEPIVGATSLMDLLGVDLAEYNMDYLVNMACDAVAESTGLDIEPLIIDFVAELTMGKVVSYQSANGETYYKMVFANEDQMTDMVTVILRLLIDFLATGENADAIIALIANNSESEDAANSASTLIHFVLTAANIEPVTSGSMAVLYYIFYGLNNGVGGLDYLYGNYGKSWDALVGFFEDTDESYLVKAAEVLKSILKEIGGVDTDSSVPNCDCDCHNNSAFIRFFFKIITFLRKLFGMNKFQICECGAAHW